MDDSDLHPLATIGRPFGALFWIVEENDPTKLAPIGVVGELFIEGPVLARNYLKDEIQTSASFVNPPHWMKNFRSKTQGRLFRSGDLAKYNPDGTVVFMGRKDTQVKLRGHRIELGEVEHQLSNVFDGMLVAAEVVRSKDQENGRIVAFVGTAGAPLSTNRIDGNIALSADLLAMRSRQIIQTLAKVLPGYMIPSMIIPIQYMPQTRTGKTDRKRLRQMVEALSVE